MTRPVAVLTGAEDPGALKIDNPPADLMVGLQGGGKTTTTAKLAKRLKEREHKRVLMASLDVYRPAAMQQARSAGAADRRRHPADRTGRKAPVQIAKRAQTQARLGGYDVSHARHRRPGCHRPGADGRGRAVRNAVSPRETTLLVVDGLTGQVAVEVAQEFDDKVGISGVVLTRMDGDGRGGAALSMRAVTGKPIRFVGLGEDGRPRNLRARPGGRPHPRHGRHRRAGRKGAGDDRGRTGRADDAPLLRSQFNMNDLQMQLEQMLKMERHGKRHGGCCPAWARWRGRSRRPGSTTSS
ncbi:MAG: hypothetical protein R3D59_09675 [Paracoccaceae bacterium]